MDIQYFGYNAFVITTSDKVLAIDPGALFFYWFRFPPLIPQTKWHEITHIFITHGDPDHYWYADKVAKASKAPVICNQTMLRNINGKQLALGPRKKGVKFTKPFDTVYPITVNETITLDNMKVTGVKATHGELLLKIGPFKTLIKPGTNARIGWGAIGFDIQVDGKRILNLGDTLLQRQTWRKHKNPDVLMIPIGGKEAHNTMDEIAALEAVNVIKPKVVIPCHYNCPGLFSKRLNPADVGHFQSGVEALGIQCAVLKIGEHLVIS